MKARLLLGSTLFFRGELGDAREHLEAVLASDDREQHQPHTWGVGLFGVDRSVLCLSYLAATLSALGYPDQALRRSREAQVRAREVGHPACLVMSLYWAGTLCRDRGEVDAACEHAEVVIALSNEHGFPSYLGMGLALRGAALAAGGQHEEGIVQIRQALEAFRATGAKMGLAGGLRLVAEACARGGDPAEGLAAVGEGLAFERETDARLWEWRRFEGELLLAKSTDAAGEAESCFRQAIDDARRESAKSLELRAATSLARLWHRQGRNAEARQLLAEIYGWFTEGFDTRDLKEAKALLEELS